MPRGSMDGELRALLESGVAVVLATSDAGLKPEITRAWGLQVLEDGQTIQPFSHAWGRKKPWPTCVPTAGWH